MRHWWSRLRRFAVLIVAAFIACVPLAAMAAATPSPNDTGTEPPACTATITSNCTYQSRDGTFALSPAVVGIGGTIKGTLMPHGGAGGGTSWTWPQLTGTTPVTCSSTAQVCDYHAIAATGVPGTRFQIATLGGGSVQGSWVSLAAYAIVPESESDYAASVPNPNTDFTGDWHTTTPGFDITSQAADGTCTGTSDLSGFSLIDCDVQGSQYGFTVVENGSAYRSVNSGTITGNTITGAFHDTNGTVESYTGTRGAGEVPIAGTGNPSVSTIASSIASPSEAFSSARAVIIRAAIAAGLVLFIVFPSQLFNSTFQENYADIKAWWEKHFSFLQKLREKAEKTDERRRGGASVVLVILIGGLFGCLLDPTFGLNGHSITTYIAVVFSTIWGMFLAGFVGYHYRKRRNLPVEWRLNALPVGLLIAAGAVLLSRISSFEPGYLYGVICGVAFTGTLQKHEQGHMAGLSTLATIVVALISWGLWDVVSRSAGHAHANVILVLLEDFFGAAFTGGIVGSMLGSFPLKFLPGGTLIAWHRGAWAGVFGLSLFLFIAAILAPHRGGSSGHGPLISVIALFVLFGGGSIWFNQHFARKKKRLAAATSVVAATAAAAEGETGA